MFIFLRLARYIKGLLIFHFPVVTCKNCTRRETYEHTKRPIRMEETYVRRMVYFLGRRELFWKLVMNRERNHHDTCKSKSQEGTLRYIVLSNIQFFHTHIAQFCVQNTPIFFFLTLLLCSKHTTFTRYSLKFLAGFRVEVATV